MQRIFVLLMKGMKHSLLPSLLPSQNQAIYCRAPSARMPDGEEPNGIEGKLECAVKSFQLSNSYATKVSRTGVL